MDSQTGEIEIARSHSSIVGDFVAQCQYQGEVMLSMEDQLVINKRAESLIDDYNCHIESVENLPEVPPALDCIVIVILVGGQYKK